MDATGYLTGLLPLDIKPYIESDSLLGDDAGTKDEAVEIQHISRTSYQEEKNLWPAELFFGPIWDYIDDNNWIAGGSVNRWLSGAQKLGEADFDLFSVNPEALRRRIEVENVLVKETKLTWTYLVTGGYKVQIIKRAYSDLDSVLRSFDFSVRMAGLDVNGVLFLGPTTLIDIDNKRIRFNKGDFSLTATSLSGLMRYANRGYKIDWVESKKFLKAWGVNVTEEY